MVKRMHTQRGILSSKHESVFLGNANVCAAWKKAVFFVFNFQNLEILKKIKVCKPKMPALQSGGSVKTA